MANRYVMRACSMVREGKSMNDVRFWLDTQATKAPPYIKAEAETRAEYVRAAMEELAALRARQSKQKKGKRERAVLRYRAERRNDFAGIRHVGNTKPEDRERTGSFQYVNHPTVRQAHTAADRAKAHNAHRAAHVAKVLSMAPALDALAFLMAAMGIGRMMPRARPRGRGQ